MPTTLSVTDISNLALARVGAQAINSLLDQTSASAIACNTNWQEAYLSVTRQARWNCLLATAVLTPIPQTPLPGYAPPPNPATWAPNTTYQANTYLTYGNYYYQVAFTYTSTFNFENDLTTGALIQTNLPVVAFPFTQGFGSQYPSGWAFEYALPDDFQLLAVMNDNVYWDFNSGGGQDYQIMGTSIFCNQSQAVIQYVQNAADTTKFDSLFVDALAFKLAAMIATTLRQDGGVLEKELLQGYEMALRQARTRNAGEQQVRRFNLIASSRFNAARYSGING